MNFFEEVALRLKQQLKATEDKQVAEALGMTGSAWTQRKKRGSFPEKELRALAQQRPDLGIDVEYVLTGGTLTAHQRQAQERAYAFTQAMDASPQDRARLLSMLDGAGTVTASAHVSRAAMYADIKDVLAVCSDATLELVLKLVVKLHRAELAEVVALKEPGPPKRAMQQPEIQGRSPSIGRVHGQVVQGDQHNDKELNFTSNFGVEPSQRK